AFTTGLPVPLGAVPLQKGGGGASCSAPPTCQDPARQQKKEDKCIDRAGAKLILCSFGCGTTAFAILSVAAGPYCAIKCNQILDEDADECRDNNPCRAKLTPSEPVPLGSQPLQTPSPEEDPIVAQIAGLAGQIQTLSYPYVIQGQPLPPDVQSQI